jgi:hypothetical protein
VQNFCNGARERGWNQPIILPGWPDVLRPRQSRSGDRSRLQSHIVFIILGLALATRGNSLT